MGLFNFHFQLFFVVPGLFNLLVSSRDNISCIGAIKRFFILNVNVIEIQNIENKMIDK